MYQEIGLSVSVLASFLLGLLVYRRNPQHATHQALSLLCVANGILAVANYLAVREIAATHGLFWTRIDMAIAVIHSGAFFMLMYIYPRVRMSVSRKKQVLFIGFLVITAAVAASPLTFTGVKVDAWGSVSPVPGPGIAVFGIVAIGLFPLGIFLLIRKLWRAKGLERVQLRYLLLGVIFTFILIASFQFLNVIIRGDISATTLLPLFLLPFVGLTTYTIFRHRLFDIRAAIARSLSFSLLIGAFFLIYGAILIFAVPFIANVFQINDGIVAAIGALLSVVIARYIQEVLRQITDRYLFQQQADYRAALVKTGRRLSQSIKIEEVTSAIIDILHSVIRNQKSVIFLQEPSGDEFTPRAASGVKKYRVAIPANHVLVTHLKHTGGPIVRDEILAELEMEQSTRHEAELRQLYDTMQWTDSAVAIPLFIEKGLSGFILLSDKKSGQPYLKEDIEFLEALTPQAAISLENARLYEESLRFGEKLKDEVQRATKDLEIANQQLKELDKAKSEFLSIASHQLYTPLTAIRGYLSMLKEGDFGRIPEKQQPIVDILIKSSSRLIDLIKNLLDISRIESGRLQLNLEKADLSEMTQELIADLLPNAHAKELALEYHKPENPVAPIIADRQRLRQVLLNFVDNAIKYTDHGRVDVYVYQEGNEVVFEVTDTGKGLAVDEIGRLFSKFTRVGDASHYHTEGTGLGLYVARKIVREHHGDVQVTSPGKDQGSSFFMRLPVADSVHSLKLGDKVSVVIKAAEAGAKSADA